ncbi:5'-nucleotidase [Pseudogemmobacter bohemicus]|uniref:5'-nucleotidase n=1 Tax=Pseudogemmobacter bohemicus TaxID=2250708 RepID=UPI000DD3930B|nr:5'-nucleotidase [Pseudogemmobacter bohemicus]
MDPVEARAYLQAHPLRIGVSTRSLFELDAEDRIFSDEGVDAYVKYQREHEEDILGEGAAFQTIKRILALNEDPASPYVEVVLMSKNSPDLSLRAFTSAKAYGLPIRHGSFTSGRSLAPYLPAWGIDLFLSNDETDVRSAAASGAASALLRKRPPDLGDALDDGELRVAFDGDAVIFGPESDAIYARSGLEQFLTHEADNAQVPMQPGPLAGFFRKLSMLRAIHMNPSRVSKVRIAVVTARNAPAHARAIHTLRSWGADADEAHFVGRNSKAPILKAMGAHIFFDDQAAHVDKASSVVPSGLVPGPHAPDAPVIPA